MHWGVKGLGNIEEIKAYLSEAPYCPVCYYTNIIMDKQYRWLFRQNYHSEPFINQLSEGGFCSVHSWQVGKSPQAYDMTYPYSTVLNNYAYQIYGLLNEIKRRTKKKTGLLSYFYSRLFGNRQPKDKSNFLQCPFCDLQKRSDLYYLTRLLRGLDSGKLIKLYNNSPGLCRIHLYQALKKCSDKTRVILLGKALETVEEVLKDLEEYKRKRDYRYKDEPKGSEQTAWQTAMQMYDGYRKYDS